MRPALLTLAHAFATLAGRPASAGLPIGAPPIVGVSGGSFFDDDSELKLAAAPGAAHSGIF